jgi:tRNA 2-thiouridine synthesizing protein D
VFLFGILFMAQYSVLITSSPFHGDNALRALQFIAGVIDSGSSIDNVFFYGDGVYHTNNLMLEAGGECFSFGEWKKLSEAHNVKLLVCITAAVKRGIVSEQEAVNNGIASANLSAPFIQAGLGEFFTELHSCTRLVQF